MVNSSSIQIKEYKILSALPVLGQPRDAKRISMLQSAGFLVEVIAFHREHHKGRIPDCPIIPLGKISNGHYFRRIVLMVLAIPLMRRAIKRNHLIYASGPDMALLAIIANVGLGKPVVLEVGDIRKVQVSTGVIGKLVRVMDRFVVNASQLLVVTAPRFVDDYYRKWLNTQTPAIVLENKLETSISNDDQVKVSKLIKGTPLLDRPIYIGYFGVLRCDWSWQVLEKLALSRPNDIKIIVAGHILEPIDLAERAANISNIEFRGEYRSPQDLPSLYGDVDLVWACYPSPGIHDENWRWAQMICRSNRFYESCYFKKPIISVAGSADAKEVERYGIGIVVTDQSIDGMLDVLTNITSEKFVFWGSNLSTIPKNVYENTTEVDELAQEVRKIINNNSKFAIN